MKPIPIDDYFNTNINGRRATQYFDFHDFCPFMCSDGIEIDIMICL